MSAIMHATPYQQILDLLSTYLSGQMRLSEFNREFAPFSWESEELSQSVDDLCQDIELLIAEYAAGQYSEADLKRRLAKIDHWTMPPLVCNVSGQASRNLSTIRAHGRVRFKLKPGLTVSDGEKTTSDPATVDDVLRPSPTTSGDEPDRVLSGT